MADQGLFRVQALASMRDGSTGEAIFFQPLTLKIMVLLLVCVFGMFLIFAATADINQTVVVRGLVSAQSGEVKVYSLRPGQLDSLQISNGDIVSRSQVLATIMESGIDRNGQDILQKSALHVEDQISQLTERLDLTQQRLMLQKSLAHSRQLSLDTEIDVRQEEYRLASWQLENAQGEYLRLEQLNRSRAVSDSDLASAELSLLAAQKALQMSRLALHSATVQRQDSALQQDLERIRLTDESLTLSFSLSQLQQRRDEMRLEHSYSLTAPVDGRIENLLNRSGDQLNPRQPLLSIAPVEPVYRAQMFLPSRALGKVAEGQTVVLRYDAFPLHEYGSFTAIVSSISALPIDPREYMIPLEINEPVYMLEADLDKGNIPLRSGLQFSAELIVGSQTILGSVLKPLRTLESRLK